MRVYEDGTKLLKRRVCALSTFEATVRVLELEMNVNLPVMHCMTLFYICFEWRV